jgi:exodeoxyribonuclease V alpha subunit
MIMDQYQDNFDAHSENLSRALYSYFSDKEEKENLPVLDQLLRRLVRVQVQTGRIFLNPSETLEITDSPTALNAIGAENEKCPLVFTEMGRLYFRRYFQYEYEIAQCLRRLGEQTESSLAIKAESLFNERFRSSVDEFQALAIAVAMHQRWMLLCGGPGTGKTRTMVIFLSLLIQIDSKAQVALVAPTGKAAFRLQQALEQAMIELGLPDSLKSQVSSFSKTSTIHRLLGVVHGSVDFHRNKTNQLPHDVVVVDEASMVDLPVMSKLFQSLKPSARIILSGDAEQLSPVQGGGVFNSLVRASDSNMFLQNDLGLLSKFSSVPLASVSSNALTGHVVTLMKSHRQDRSKQGRNLGILCDLISKGDAGEVLSFIHDHNEGIELIESLDDSKLETILIDGFENLLKAEKVDDALSTLNDFRVLCAHNFGRYGVDQWNERAKYSMKSSEETFSPIVVRTNDYGLDLFNGDDGVQKDEKAYFSKGGGVREVAKSRLSSTSSAFALSIHRSQGSEYGRVLLVLPPPEAKLLSRELLYVAVSRAKKGIVLVGDSESLASAVKQVGEVQAGVAELI